MTIHPFSLQKIPDQPPFQGMQDIERKEAEIEVPTPSFDAETLFNAIAIDMSASEIAAMNPSLLPTLAEYTKSDLFKIFEPWVASCEEDSQEEIYSTLETLYLIALMNSTFQKITNDLETKIAEYLPKTTKEKFQALIKKGTLAIDQRPPNTLADIEKETIRLMTISAEINDQLMLFSYLDSAHFEKIKTICTYAQTPHGTPQFPNCKNHLSNFYSNLKINENERLELRKIQKSLTQKIWDLRKMIQASGDSPAVSEREKLYSHLERDFWQAGVKIMEIALRETFTKKRENRRFYLPEVFVKAIKKASEIKDFRHLHFHRLIEDPTLKLDIQFILAIWNEYMGPVSSINDPADLMKLILSKMDEKLFLKLQNDLKRSLKRDEIIYNAAKQFLIDQIRGNITFLSLKYWTTKK